MTHRRYHRGGVCTRSVVLLLVSTGRHGRSDMWRDGNAGGEGHRMCRTVQGPPREPRVGIAQDEADFMGGGQLEDACVGYRGGTWIHDVPQNQGRRSDGTTTSALCTSERDMRVHGEDSASGMDGRRRIHLRDLREDNSVSWDASIPAAGRVQAGAREFRHTPSDDRVRRQMPVGETRRRRSWRRSSSSTSGSIVCTMSTGG